MSSGIFRFFGASIATMLVVGFALAPTPAPAQGLQCRREQKPKSTPKTIAINLG